jgi:hypothetical protein
MNKPVVCSLIAALTISSSILGMKLDKTDVRAERLPDGRYKLNVITHKSHIVEDEANAVGCLTLGAILAIQTDQTLYAEEKARLLRHVNHIKTVADFDEFKKYFDQETQFAERRNDEEGKLRKALTFAIIMKNAPLFQAIMANSDPALIYKIFTNPLIVVQTIGEKLFSPFMLLAFELGSPEIGQLIQEFIDSPQPRLYPPIANLR